MINWIYDSESNAGMLQIDGELTINGISALKESIIKAFDSAGQVTIDLSSATAVDVAGLQLLCASHRFSSKRGQKMCLRYKDNIQFTGFLDQVGFTQDFVCSQGDSDECLWTQTQ